MINIDWMAGYYLMELTLWARDFAMTRRSAMFTALFNALL